MSSKTIPLFQCPFHYTGTRVFRLSCIHLEKVYIGDFPLENHLFSVITEVMEKFVQRYKDDSGRSFYKSGEDTYELNLYSEKVERYFTIGVTYMEESGRFNQSSSLYYFSVDFIL